MNSLKPPCMAYYVDAVKEFASFDDPALLRAFAGGFISGQAEKVFLRACYAAMFRPASEHHALVEEIVISTCERYYLSQWQIGTEIWIFRPGGEGHFLLSRLNEMFSLDAVNTPQWHLLRAELCGVPASRIDIRFHERYEEEE